MQDRHYFDQQMNGETPDMNANQAILKHPVAFYSREYDQTLKAFGYMTMLDLYLKRMKLNLNYPVDRELKKFCEKFFKSLDELNELLKDRSKVYGSRVNGGQNESGNQQSILSNIFS